MFSRTAVSSYRPLPSAPFLGSIPTPLPASIPSSRPLTAAASSGPLVYIALPFTPPLGDRIPYGSRRHRSHRKPSHDPPPPHSTAAAPLPLGEDPCAHPRRHPCTPSPPPPSPVTAPRPPSPPRPITLFLPPSRRRRSHRPPPRRRCAGNRGSGRMPWGSLPNRNRFRTRGPPAFVWV